VGRCRQAVEEHRHRRLNRVINDAKKQGNSYFVILGGEPFLYRI